jgi:hypothetical protein
MFFLGTLPLLVLKIWGTTFHNIQVEDDYYTHLMTKPSSCKSILINCGCMFCVLQLHLHK